MAVKWGPFQSGPGMPSPNKPSLTAGDKGKAVSCETEGSNVLTVGPPKFNGEASPPLTIGP